MTWGAASAVLSPFVSRLTGPKRWVAIVTMMLVTVILAAIPGGLLWAIHDMQAGYFPPADRLQSALIRGAADRLAVGWIVIALSIRNNIVMLLRGYRVTETGLRFLRPRA